VNKLDAEDMTMLSHIAKIFNDTKQEKLWAKMIKDENETLSTNGSNCEGFVTGSNTDRKVYLSNSYFLLISLKEIPCL